ncbi:MAG: SxtJ family membrane protein [Thermodesulfovibrionales bacterium]
MDKEEKRSLRITSVIFSFLAGVVSYKLYPSPGSYAFIALIVLLLSASIIRPTVLLPLFHIWLRIGRLLGKFNTMVLLGLIFYLVFLPSRMIMQLTGKDFMKRKLMKDASYWEDYRLSGPDDVDRYERQF